MKNRAGDQSSWPIKCVTVKQSQPMVEDNLILQEQRLAELEATNQQLRLELESKQPVVTPREDSHDSEDESETSHRSTRSSRTSRRNKTPSESWSSPSQSRSKSCSLVEKASIWDIRQHNDLSSKVAKKTAKLSRNESESASDSSSANKSRRSSHSSKAKESSKGSTSSKTTAKGVKPDKDDRKKSEQKRGKKRMGSYVEKAHEREQERLTSQQLNLTKPMERKLSPNIETSPIGIVSETVAT